VERVFGRIESVVKDVALELRIKDAVVLELRGLVELSGTTVDNEDEDAEATLG
jgi:hypothetical protein